MPGEAARLKRLHAVGFHLCDGLAKAKLSGWQRLCFPRKFHHKGKAEGNLGDDETIVDFD